MQQFFFKNWEKLCREQNEKIQPADDSIFDWQFIFKKM